MWQEKWRLWIIRKQQCLNSNEKVAIQSLNKNMFKDGSIFLTTMPPNFDQFGFWNAPNFFLETRAPWSRIKFEVGMYFKKKGYKQFKRGCLFFFVSSWTRFFSESSKIASKSVEKKKMKKVSVFNEGQFWCFCYALLISLPLFFDVLKQLCLKLVC